MTRTRPLLVTGALAATLLGCPARTPAAPGAAPPVRVPPGCEASQAGEYHHAENPAFRYLAEDDGGTLSLALVRARADGGIEGLADAGTVAIVLQRTPEGFVGETRAHTFSTAGTPCPVSFPTEALACSATELRLRAVASMPVDENCRPAPSSPPPVWKEQVLLRGAPDAGSAP